MLIYREYLKMVMPEKLKLKSVSKPVLLWAILFAFIPIFMVFLSIKNGEEFNIFQLFIRTYWVPAIIFEVFTLFMALHFDWRPLQQIKSISITAKTALIIWIFSVFISVFFSELPPVAMISSFLWLLHLGFFAAFFHLITNWNRHSDNSQILALIFPIGSAVSATIVGCYSFYIGHEIPYDWVSDMPGFSNIRHIGYLLLLGGTISVGAIISGYDKRLHFILAITNIALIIWFGSRGPFAAIIAAIVIGLLVIPAFRKIDKIISVTAVIAIAIMLSQMISTPPSDSYNILNRVEVAKIEASQASEKNIDTISSGRLVMWKDAAQMIAQKPLGHGSDQFKYTAKSAKGASRHPHNALLQIFFEWGIIGGTAFLLLIALILRIIIGDMIAGRSQAIFLLPTIAACIFALMDGLIFYSLPIALLSLLAVLQIHKSTQNI